MTTTITTTTTMVQWKNTFDALTFILHTMFMYIHTQIALYFNPVWLILN